MDPVTISLSWWQLILGVAGGVVGLAPAVAWLTWAAVRPRVEAAMATLIADEREIREAAMAAADRHCVEVRGQCAQVRGAGDASTQATLSRLSAQVDRLAAVASELTAQVARLSGELQARRPM